MSEVDIVPAKKLLLGLTATLALAACEQSVADELPELSGGQLFQHLCASCHGVAGRGDGPAAKTTGVKVPDLTRIAVRHGGRFPKEQVRRIVESGAHILPHGSSGMPAWSWELYAYDGEDAVRRARVAELLTRLVGYLESIQSK